MGKKYHLFEVFGIELEYMVVGRSNLKIMPVVDQLLTLKNGELTSDVDNGPVAWSNELVAHVVELKTNGPAKNLKTLPGQFHKNILEINSLLDSENGMLLPTAAHPLMDPLTETTLWQHSYSEVYALYNRIFNCKGHGWSNVQSTHINLPFYDDAEFEKLHAAIRVVLPLIPALCASSPILEGQNTGFKDTRLEYYKTNQKKIPEMTGQVIPENVFSKKEYENVIFNPINKAIKPHDTAHILDHYFLNSRGAIARFDRNAIEIRLADIQESPKADISICAFIIEVLKLLVSEKLSPLERQKIFEVAPLFDILNSCIRCGEHAIVSNLEYLKLFGINEACNVQNIWKHLYNLVKPNINDVHHQAIETILNHGTLSTRILDTLAGDLSEPNLKKVYFELAQCLQENKIFTP
ncbi:glutamate-cysteine ligase family protein [Tamlana flava]|uniref:glutamate-cysteine ligase family protein n=1 Tax=Tamlana flava TaxID=3158572 RepID=UPI00351AFC24